VTTPTEKLPLIDAATERLLATARALTDDDVRRDSLLPGWTVGHVLTHIARNADSLVNLATWARTGVRTPQYASPEARDGDIEAGADRPIAAQVDDLAASAERLRKALVQMSEESWDVVIEWRGGGMKAAGAIPSARLTEVDVHHADLGLGYGFGDIPADLRLKLLADAVEGWPDDFGVSVYAEDVDQAFPDDPRPVVVRGSSGDLLGWASGRTGPEELTYDGELPAVPEWR
jgi:maleylpyruvate isomerase